MAILYVGIDLAKNVFAVHGVNEAGKSDTKAGDPYLRSLLVMGAKALLNAAELKTDGIRRWAVALAERIREWRPWERSSGPKSEAGKAVVACNAWKGGPRQALRELSKALRALREGLDAF